MKQTNINVKLIIILVIVISSISLIMTTFTHDVSTTKKRTILFNLLVNYLSPIKQHIMNQKMILSYRVTKSPSKSITMKEIMLPDKIKRNNTLSFFVF